MPATQGLITAIIDKSIRDDAKHDWFHQTLRKIGKLDQVSDFYMGFGAIHRFIGKQPPELNETEINNIRQSYPGFTPKQWTLDQLARAAVLMHLPSEKNVAPIKTLLSTADMSESVAIYKSLYFLDNAEAFDKQVQDGIRTNMVDVFDAICLYNPYPYSYLSEDAWNQMVLKAIFMQRPIYKIYGVDDRNNAKLAMMLRDFAHERWSAGRSVTPELWRLCIGNTDHFIFEDLVKATKSDDPLSQAAAVKVMLEDTFVPAKTWLEKNNIEPPEISWDEIGRKTENS